MADLMDLQGDTSFFKKKFEIDFCDSSTQHDRVLMVQDKKFYVNSMHLSMFSEYFYGLFNSREKEQEEIELKDVTSSELEIFLKMLYPLDVKITGNNLCMLIGLSKKFLTPFIYQRCFEFVENPININKFELEEIFSLMGIINSEALKNRCIELFNVDQLARFLEVAEEYNVLALKEHIIDKICTPDNGEIALSRNLVHIILENDFTKFEKWTAGNFGRFLMHPNSQTVKYIDRLIDSLPDMSSKHKNKFEKVLHGSAKIMVGTPCFLLNLEGFKQILLQFAFILFKDDPEAVIIKTLFLLNDFPFLLNSLAIEMAYDTHLMRSFNRTNNFNSIEFVVKKNFVKTKNVIRNYLQNSSFESINNREQLRSYVKVSYEVQRFVYDCLPQNESKTDFMNYFLG